VEWATLGRSGLPVTRLGFGGAPIGGLYSAVSDSDAEESLRAAWAMGVRLFDTAPHYGAGRSEQRLGRFLAGLPRDEYVVSTKVGRLLVDTHEHDGDIFADEPARRRVRDYSAEGVYRSIAASLERTGLDRFDIVLIHDPDDAMTEAIEQAYPALHRLREQGAVRAIGAGMNQTPALVRFVEETDMDCVLVAGRYSLLDRRAADDLLPACERRGTGVIVGGVFNSGVLARPEAQATYDYAPVEAAQLRRALRLREVCDRYGVPLAAAALQFPLRHPAVTTALVGVRSADEVAQNMALSNMPIPAELWPELDAT
jgi:aryl-alcohol dehydrogenase-like predicted oxidoreductase